MARPVVSAVMGTSSMVTAVGCAVLVSVQVLPVPFLPTSASVSMAAPLLEEVGVDIPRAVAQAGAASSSDALPLPMPKPVAGSAMSTSAAGLYLSKA